MKSKKTVSIADWFFTFIATRVAIYNLAYSHSIVPGGLDVVS